jgi:hypothetical protein
VGQFTADDFRDVDALTPGQRLFDAAADHHDDADELSSDDEESEPDVGDTVMASARQGGASAAQPRGSQPPSPAEQSMGPALGAPAPPPAMALPPAPAPPPVPAPAQASSAQPRGGQGGPKHALGSSAQPLGPPRPLAVQGPPRPYSAGQPRPGGPPAGSQAPTTGRASESAGGTAPRGGTGSGSRFHPAISATKATKATLPHAAARVAATEFEFDEHPGLDSLLSNPCGFVSLEILRGPRAREGTRECVSCHGKETTTLESCSGCDDPLHHIPCGLTLLGEPFQGEGEAYCCKCARNASGCSMSAGAQSHSGELYRDSGRLRVSSCSLSFPCKL